MKAKKILALRERLDNQCTAQEIISYSDYSFRFDPWEEKFCLIHSKTGQEHYFSEAEAKGLKRLLNKLL